MDSKLQLKSSNSVKYLKRICKSPVEVTCGILMALITGIVFLQVISRYVFHHPFDWPEEMARFIFVWIALLGAAIALKRGVHFSINAVVKRLPNHFRLAVGMCSNLILSIFILLVTIRAIQLTLRVEAQVSAATEIPMSFPYSAVPISFALMFIYTVMNFWKMIKERK